MDESDIEVSHISITTVREYETTDALMGRFRALEDINAPSGFKNRIVDIDSEEPVESELHIGESGSTPPDEAVSNRVRISVSERNGEEEEEETTYSQLIFFRFNAEHIGEFQTLLNEIVGKVGQLELDLFWTNVEFEGELEKLEVPIETTSDKDIEGIRFSSGGDRYMVQKARNDEHNINATYYTESEETLDPETSDNLIQERVSRAKRKMIDLVK